MNTGLSVCMISYIVLLHKTITENNNKKQVSKTSSVIWPCFSLRTADDWTEYAAKDGISGNGNCLNSNKIKLR